MENLGIDTKLLMAQLVNYAIFFFVFKRYMAKPFMEFLRKEHKIEEERQALMNMLKKQEEEYVNKEKELKQDMKKEMDAVLKQATIDGEEIKKEATQQAKREADQIIEHTKEQLAEERQSLYKDVKNQAADLSLLLINKALKNYLTEDIQKKLTEYILSKAGKASN